MNKKLRKFMGVFASVIFLSSVILQPTVAMDDLVSTSDVVVENVVGSNLENVVVKSYVSDYDDLPVELQKIIEKKLTEWDLEAPLDNTFYIESVRIEKDWGIISVRAKDEYDSGKIEYPEDMEVHPGVNQKIVYSTNSNGQYVAAYKSDKNIVDVLDNISDDELSLQAKVAIWDYPVSDAQMDEITSSSATPKFPWQSYTSYRVNSRYPEWHADGFGRWSIDFVPSVNTEDARRILSPISGTVTSVCRGSVQTYIILKDANNVDIYDVLHLTTSTVPSSIVNGMSISQGTYIGSLYNGSHNQTNSCIQNTTGAHVHLSLPSKNFVLDGYTFATTTTTSNYLQLTTRTGQVLTYPNITGHSLVSTLPANVYTVTQNCQNGTNGSYCYDASNPHVLHGKMTKGTNSAGKTYIKVQVPKVNGGNYLYGGTVKVYDASRNVYISRLDYSSNVTAGQSSLTYQAGITTLTFYIDPTYLNINENNNLSVRLFPSNGGSFYIDFHKVKRQQG